MADEADIAQALIELEESIRPHPASKDLTQVQGDCMDCGEHSLLVESLCIYCRRDAERRARA